MINKSSVRPRLSLTSSTKALISQAASPGHLLRGLAGRRERTWAELMAKDGDNGSACPVPADRDEVGTTLFMGVGGASTALTLPANRLEKTPDGPSRS
jgi:hypothetical protein